MLVIMIIYNVTVIYLIKKLLMPTGRDLRTFFGPWLMYNN